MKWIVKFIVRQSPIAPDMVEEQVIEADKVRYDMTTNGTAVFYKEELACNPVTVAIIRDFSSITQVKSPE